jgi:hypothetical protein
VSALSNPPLRSAEIVANREAVAPRRLQYRKVR